MPEVRVNDVNLFYEMTGEGDPLVLVHGSWADHYSWQAVVPGLAESFRVVAFDRRGHSQSERPSGQGSRREDEDDLAALMETLGVAPAHVAGNSFGASITLGLAARRRELFRSLIAHEPPLVSLVAADPELQPMMQEFQAKAESVIRQLKSGDTEGGTRRFVEEIAVGPGAWEQFPEEVRRAFINNAPTWVDESEDPHWNDIDLEALSAFTGPALLTQGDQSFPWFPKIVQKLAEATPQAQQRTYHGAGHIPHITHPDDYVAGVTEFLTKASGS